MNTTATNESTSWEAPELREESIAGTTNYIAFGTDLDAPEFYSTGTPS